MSLVKAVPISGRRGAFVCGSVAFSSGTFSLSSHQDMKDVMTQIHGSTQRDDIVPILDVDSFDRKFLNTDLIKEMRLRGRRLWLISYIRSVDDIIDTMCGSFDRLCIPYHTIDDPDVLSEAQELTECVIPTVFVSKGKDAFTGKSIDPVIKNIERLGYDGHALFDVDDCTLTYCGPMTEFTIVS